MSSADNWLIQGPFQLNGRTIDRFTSLFGPLARQLPERLLAFPDLNRIHTSLAKVDSHGDYCRRALRELDVRLEVSDTDQARIPRSGPLIVIANHPFGGLDGLALASLLQRVRPDVKLLANHVLKAVPELRETMLFVDPFGGGGASVQRNRRAIRDAVRWVRGGGALGIFPAGEVSHLKWNRHAVADGPWNAMVARIAQMTSAPLLPIFFEGRNSMLFQLAGLVHPLLRTVLLPRELLKRRGSRVCVHVGSPITAERLARFHSFEEATAYLRVRTHVLKGRCRDNRSMTTRLRDKAAERIDQPLATSEDLDELEIEVQRLPAERHLCGSGSFGVYFASASEIPANLREIGRLREATFRMVGEGTGRTRDLDRFDQHYLHLFVWHREQREIIGAYRLGLTDRILSEIGRDGLYTSTLFRFGEELLGQITPGIELGRSFVRAEYQKDYAPLMLLWKGIAQFALRNPRYRMLFGPVSISNRYRSLSKQILMAFLRTNNRLPKLAALLSPRNPPKLGGRYELDAVLSGSGTVVNSIDDVDELVAEIEQERLGVPVLLRQYLKLRAKLLGFNVDPDFGDVLDGLMLVDLLQVERTILARYMGRDNADRFHAFHAQAERACSSV